MVIRTAIIGFGTAGRLFHAPFLSANPAFRIDAIVTRSPERSALARREYPQARVLRDIDALLAIADDIDLVIVASPSSYHGAHTEASLNAGCHVVVDKPFVADAAQGQALIALAAKRARMLTVFQNRRWDGDFQTLRSLIAAGRLGEVRRFESRFSWWQPEASGGWKTEVSADDAGGILFDLGPHLIDQALQLFGPGRPVYAEVDRARIGVAADDDVFVALDHDSGVRSHLWMSAVTPEAGPRFRVLGTKAAYVSWGSTCRKLRSSMVRGPAKMGSGRPRMPLGTLAAGDAREFRLSPATTAASMPESPPLLPEARRLPSTRWTPSPVSASSPLPVRSRPH